MTVSVAGALGGADEAAVAARPVGEDLDVVEPRHGVRDQERAQRGEVDERRGHPPIKAHATDAADDR